MIRQTLATGLLAGLIGLSGCTLLPESEALVVYQFPQPAPTAASHAGQPLSLSLRVDTPQAGYAYGGPRLDRKSTRLNSSHVKISYAVFCLKKKKKTKKKR